LIPVGAAATQFVAQASAIDIEGNPAAESIVTVNINQPAIIAASLPYNATDDTIIVTTGELLELTGVGYNTAFGDIREVTIEEGTSLSIKIAANDSNVADIVTLSATGSAVTSEKITEGTYTVTSGAGAGEMDFSFTPGYLAVTGDVDMATFELDVTALDGTTIASDSMKLVFNVLAKSATPIVSIESIKVNETSRPITDPIGTVQLSEGSTIEIVYKAQDPGNEVLDVELSRSCGCSCCDGSHGYRGRYRICYIHL
jgi:predicted DNA-binding antitoxin AbrB/MazE fold protein